MESGRTTRLEKNVLHSAQRYNCRRKIILILTPAQRSLFPIISWDIYILREVVCKGIVCYIYE